ncbi:MAG: hypothetical protein HC912_10815 [Saprospiraceae bacterium]|nr:hypothetical protein [Saprospiraceae bacterium]
MTAIKQATSPHVHLLGIVKAKQLFFKRKNTRTKDMKNEKKCQAFLYWLMNAILMKKHNIALPNQQA